MRHLFNALGLLLLLMVAQQGAVVHELGHVSADMSGRPSAWSDRAADTACTLCPAFAQVATPAFSHSFPVPVLVLAASQRSTELHIAAIEAAVPHPRSRGPPALS